MSLFYEKGFDACLESSLVKGLVEALEEIKKDRVILISGKVLAKEMTYLAEIAAKALAAYTETIKKMKGDV